jgi:2-desacetyl-2-hydroxyethyl bacteriochlorophyllide A dehydrogenase
LRGDELLISVKACGICGTDLHIFDGTTDSNPPIIPGHEYAGTIVDAGDNVNKFKKGERVAIDPNIYCGKCYYCRRNLVHFCESQVALGVHLNGGFAEYSIVPVAQIYRLPDNVPLEWGVFAEPLSCVIHGVDLAEVQLGDTVVILGAGAIGLMMIELLRSSGAGRIFIVEPSKERREIAEKLKPDLVINPEEVDVIDAVMKNTYDGSDVVMECAGTPETAKLSLELIRRGGRVIFFGVCDKEALIEISPQKIYYNEISIKGSFINPYTFSRSIELLSLGKIDFNKFSIAKFELNELLKAFEFHKKREVTKIIILPEIK